MEMIVTPYLKLSNNKELLIICAFEEKHRLIWTYITLVFHSLYLNLNKDGATNLFSIWRYKSGMHLYCPSVFLRMKNPVFRMAFLFCNSCFHLSSKQKLCWSKELQGCFSNFSQASPERIQGAWKAKLENLLTLIHWTCQDLKIIKGHWDLSKIHIWVLACGVKTFCFLLIFGGI